MGSFGTSGSGLARLRQPATTALVGAIVLSYVLAYAQVLDWSALAFFPERLWQAPWTALTYPFSIPPSAVFTVLFASLWLWGIGGDIERRDGPLRMGGCGLGSPRFALFLCGWVTSSLGARAQWPHPGIRSLRSR
ncbi:conserved hypothetical protein [Candidatus Nitrosymbiomonas proteolyticus]|uniref:Uncharacterized protein n=1 Tax=Candidatus Nitrosymbiomonas proteolyticus TaxID=2608984 RepID=A0A809S8B7_9BACT|nr:conserved hypothetical protein [Candidatus Nitrosymbiomonas proteolyticus]